MKLKHLTTSALALILMSACTDDGATGVAPDDLAGTWTATAMVFTSVADPATSADLVLEGATLTLVLGADGSYSFIFVFPGEPTEDEAGVYEVSGTTLTLSITGTGSPDAWEISRNGDTMTLTDSAEVFDFVDGVEEDATLVVTLVRL